MSLFYTNRMLHLVAGNSLKLETPLGNVESNIKINGFPNSFKSLLNVNSIESNNFLISWKCSLYEIDCLRTMFVPILVIFVI